MNIKLRLSEEVGLVEGGPTLEFVLENEEVLLKEEAKEQIREQKFQFCAKATENDRTEPCSSQTPNSNNRPDTAPWPL